MPQVNIWLNNEEIDRLNKVCKDCKRSRYDLAKEALLKKLWEEEEKLEQRSNGSPEKTLVGDSVRATGQARERISSHKPYFDDLSSSQ